MAPVGLKHWMLHNDQLANEYDETLKLSPGYDPVRAVDPALTFHAPLLTGPDSIPGAIRATFDRNSEATYQAPRGAFLLTAGDDESRHEYTPEDEPLGVLIEPAITNKSENYNANPDPALTGLAKGGDASATLTRVQDIVGLEAAGLQNICTSGYVVRLNNTAGSSNAWVSISGGAQNTNTHQGSVYWKGTGNAFLAMITPNPSQALTANYQRFVQSLTPPGAGAILQIAAQPGADVYFILNQLEEEIVPSSVIVTEGAAAARAVDGLQWSLGGYPAGPQVLTDPDICDGVTNWNPTVSLCGSGTTFGTCYAEILDYTNAECIMLRQDNTISAGSIYEIQINVGEMSGIGNLRVLMGGDTVGRVEEVGTTTIIGKADSNFIQINVQNASDFSVRVERVTARQLTSVLNQSEGMAAVILRPGFSNSDLPSGAVTPDTILTLTDNLIYYEKLPDDSDRFRSNNGANAVFVPITGGISSDKSYVIPVRWSGTSVQLGHKVDGVWSWSVIGTFGSWGEDGFLNLHPIPSFPMHLSNVYLWSEDKGTAWLEEYFSKVAN